MLEQGGGIRTTQKNLLTRERTLREISEEVLSQLKVIRELFEGEENIELKNQLSKIFKKEIKVLKVNDIGRKLEIENLSELIFVESRNITKIRIQCIDEGLSFPNSKMAKAEQKTFVDEEDTLVICIPGCGVLIEGTDYEEQVLVDICTLIENLPNLETVEISDHRACGAVIKKLQELYPGSNPTIAMEDNIRKGASYNLANILTRKLYEIKISKKTQSNETIAPLPSINVKVEPTSEDEMLRPKKHISAFSLWRNIKSLGNTVRNHFMHTGNLAEALGVRSFGVPDIGSLQLQAETMVLSLLIEDSHGLGKNFYSPENPYPFIICLPKYIDIDGTPTWEETVKEKVHAIFLEMLKNNLDLNMIDIFVITE